MKTIWRFELPSFGMFTILMPRGAKVLSTASAGDSIAVWALIDPDAPSVKHLFAVKGTGHDVESIVEQGNFIGTVFNSLHEVPLVWHIFSLGDIN